MPYQSMNGGNAAQAYGQKADAVLISDVILPSVSNKTEISVSFIFRQVEAFFIILFPFTRSTLPDYIRLNALLLCLAVFSGVKPLHI